VLSKNGRVFFTTQDEIKDIGKIVLKTRYWTKLKADQSLTADTNRKTVCPLKVITASKSKRADSIIVRAIQGSQTRFLISPH
jgi:hypothetical protein